MKLLDVEYPDESVANETQGSVRIEITFDSPGIVTGARGITGAPSLMKAALEATNKWTTVPMIDGLQHPFSVDVDVDFKITPEQAPTASFPEVKNPEGVTATMERGGCYGRCPVYRLKIYGNGWVEYEGIAYVSSKGKRRARILPADVNQLLADFRSANYFSFDEEYINLHRSTEITVKAGGCNRKVSVTHIGTATDLPSTVTTLTIGDKTKKVLDYYGAPAALRKLETQIDQLVHSERWVRGSRDKNP